MIDYSRTLETPIFGGELGYSVNLTSLSRASAALDLPPSVVSRHIAQLETESGSRLFRRTGRGVVLTELGERIYPRVKALIREGEQLADDIRTSRGVPMGEVRLGLLPSTVALLASWAARW